ncbi:uncharacterized protein LOC135806644 [Sycon ciliatum]|uniref:uncharacterized protein LOC135806644 n=1 Tax=Sycon ciliatum TaxID=27933 RepID=UPI0031F63C9E
MLSICQPDPLHSLLSPSYILSCMLEHLQDHYISHIVRTLRMDIRYGYANIVFTNEPPAALLSHLCEAIAMEGNQAAKITVWNVGNVDKLKEELEEHGVPEGRVRLHAESFVTAADIRDDLLIDTELVIVNPPSSKELIANVVRVSVRDPTHSTFLETIGNLRQNFKYRGKTYNYFDIQSNTLRAALELPKVKSILYVTHSSAMSENHCLIETVLEELHGSKRAFKRSARAWKTEHAQDLLRKRIPTPEKNLKRSEIDDIDDMDVLSGKQSQLSKSTAENQQSMADTEHGGTPHATGGHGADATGEHVMAATCQQDATGQQKDKEKDTLEGEKAPDTQEVTTAVVVEPETEKGALRTATQPQATRRTSLSGGGRRKTVSFSGVEKQQLTSQNRGARARTVSLSSVPKPKLQQKPLSKPTQKPLQKQAQKTLVTQKPAKGATQQGNQTKPAKKVARPVRTKSISSEQPAAKTVKKKVKKKTTPTLEEKFAYYDDYDNGGEAEGTFEMQTIVDPYRLEEFCQNDGESRMQVMQPTVWADGWALGHLKRVPPPKEKPSAILERYQTMGILNLDEEPAPKPATPPRKAAPLPKVSIEGKAALRRAMAHHARHTTNTGGQKSKGYADMQDVPQAEVQSHHKMSTVHGPMELAGNGSTTVYGREKARNPQPTVSNVQRRRHQRNQAAAPPPPVPPAQPEPVVGSLMRPGVWIPELALGISPKQMRSSFDVLGMSSGSSNSTTLGSDLLHSNVLTHHSPRQTERLHEHTSNRISSRNRPPDHLPLNTDNVQDGADSLIQMDINQARGELPIIAALRLNSSHPPNSPGSPRQQQRMFQHPAAAGKLNSNLLSPGGQQGMLYHEIPPTAQQPSHLPPIGLASNLSSSHSAAAAVASPRDSLEKSLLSPRVKGTPPSTPTFLPPITHSPLARRKGVIQNSPRSATL